MELFGFLGVCSRTNMRKGSIEAMKRTILFTGMLICVLMLVSLPAYAAGSLDQHYVDTHNAGGALNWGAQLAAQTFTAGVTGTLTGLNVGVSSNMQYPMRVAIRAMDGGVPASTELGYAIVSTGDQSPDMLGFLITLSPGVAVSAGTEYAIVVSFEGAPIGGIQGTWQGHYPGEYLGGKMCNGGPPNFQVGEWWCDNSVPSTDFFFRTYVTVDTSSNVAPTAEDVSVETDEDTTVEIVFSATDPDNDPLSYAVVSGPAHGVLDSDFFYTPDLDFNGEDSFTYTANDGTADSNVATITITVLPVNDPPAVGPITAPVDPAPVNTTVNASATFTDVDLADEHEAVWNWGDGSTSTGTLDGSGGVAGSHAYTTAGIHTVMLTVTDAAGDAATAFFEHVVVYDPEGGFVTGGGWIDSPAGAYKDDTNLSGKATFAFVSKYKRGASVPNGNTAFEFETGSLEFASDTYDWLVVNRAGTYAQFKGSGRVNGVDGYKFMLWAGDSEPDTFRIRIWTEDAAGMETDVYDNGSAQAIGGGSIVVHKGK
jgi:hypothetical protein